MNRRLLAVLCALMLAATLLPGSALAQPTGGPLARHEIWALDQGTGLNRIHVYDQNLDEVAVIELDDHLLTPHMIDFDSRYRYAFVAGTTGQGVAVVRTADYELVDVIRTGPGAHMAAVTPDDGSVWVANIGARTFTEITLDLDNEVFEIGRELDVTADPAWQAEFGDITPVAAPVCHEYTADGRFAYVTLGPGAHSGGVIVVDVASAEPSIVKAFSRDDVKANCGLARSLDGTTMYANWGDPGPVADPPPQTGEWYVFDTSDHTLVKATDETRGIDAHGVRITPDGRELWQVNRGSDNGIVVDTATDEIIDEIGFPGNDADLGPDILDFSPDGRRAYVSLRGPHPITGAPHVATGSHPGFAVFDVASRELIEIIEPAAGTDEHESSDFHGIGVRAIGAVPGAQCANPAASAGAGSGLGKGRASVPDHVGPAPCGPPAETPGRAAGRPGR